MPLILDEISVDFIHGFLDKLLTLARATDERDFQTGSKKDTLARFADLNLRSHELNEQALLLNAELEFHTLECHRLMAMLGEQHHPAVAAALSEAIDIGVPTARARHNREQRVLDAHWEAVTAERNILVKEYEASDNLWEEATEIYCATICEIRDTLIGVRPKIARVWASELTRLPFLIAQLIRVLCVDGVVEACLRGCDE